MTNNKPDSVSDSLQTLKYEAIICICLKLFLIIPIIPILKVYMD